MTALERARAWFEHGVKGVPSLAAAMDAHAKETLAKFIEGAHRVVTRGHSQECAKDTFCHETLCSCGFDQLREALKEVAP